MVKLIIDNEFTLVSESSGELYHGVLQKGETTEKTIKCNVQPSSREQTYSEFGYFVDAEYRAFCYADTDIQEGKKAIYKGAEYDIPKIVDWNDYYIVYLKARGL